MFVYENVLGIVILTDMASDCSATHLVRRHFPIACSSRDSCLLPPDEKRDRNEIQEERYHCCEDVEVLHAHTIDPRSDHKENNDAYDITHKDNTY